MFKVDNNDKSLTSVHVAHGDVQITHCIADKLYHNNERTYSSNTRSKPYNTEAVTNNISAVAEKDYIIGDFPAIGDDDNHNSYQSGRITIIQSLQPHPIPFPSSRRDLAGSDPYMHQDCSSINTSTALVSKSILGVQGAVKSIVLLWTNQIDGTLHQLPLNEAYLVPETIIDRQQVIRSTDSTLQLQLESYRTQPDLFNQEDLAPFFPVENQHKVFAIIGTFTIITKL